jgi:hypothetical protein
LKVFIIISGLSAEKVTQRNERDLISPVTRKVRSGDKYKLPE